MNKDFFDRLDELKSGFAERSGLSEGVAVELTLSTGRTFEVHRVVRTDDNWVHVDGRDVADLEEKPVSVIVPYFQINFVQFCKPRARRQAGFAR